MAVCNDNTAARIRGLRLLCRPHPPHHRLTGPACSTPGPDIVPPRAVYVAFNTTPTRFGKLFLLIDNARLKAEATKLTAEIWYIPSSAAESPVNPSSKEILESDSRSQAGIVDPLSTP
ncbi:hypothetical protein J6590_072661 [Homalodisca vitripennis]|nr:hypothetical protein J6590_072661 [Homalodisca vitripennis]